MDEQKPLAFQTKRCYINFLGERELPFFLAWLDQSRLETKTNLIQIALLCMGSSYLTKLF